MKRLTSILLTILFVASLIGCSNDEILDELVLYVQNDVAELGALETELTASFNGLVSTGSTSNFDLYRGLSTNTMNLAIQLNDKATKVSYSIKGEELKTIHETYVDYTNLLLSALSMLTSAAETKDTSLLDTAIDKLEEADGVAQEYLHALDDFANKYGIDLTDID